MQLFCFRKKGEPYLVTKLSLFQRKRLSDTCIINVLDWFFSTAYLLPLKGMFSPTENSFFFGKTMTHLMLSCFLIHKRHISNRNFSGWMNNASTILYHYAPPYSYVVLSLNNSKFCDFVELIHPIERQRMNTD